MSDDKKNVLHVHRQYVHKPVNVNLLHKAEIKASGLNTRIAVSLTRIVGTMWTAYLFVVLAVVGLLAILGILNPLTAILVAWTSQTLIQLTLLPIIMVGQNVLGRKAELLAEEQFNTTQKSYNDLEQVMKHLDAQDAELLKQTKLLVDLVQKLQPSAPSKTGSMTTAQWAIENPTKK